MSWSDLKRWILGLVVAGALSACGYTPVYGPNSAGALASDALAQVAVAPIALAATPRVAGLPNSSGSGLVGVDVRNGLLDQINPNGTPSAPTHRLEVSLTPSLLGLLVQPDAATTRYNYTLVANYKLIDLVTGKVEMKGDIIGQSAYNVVTSEYATVSARRDAERRAARSISDELALRLALHFKK